MIRIHRFTVVVLGMAIVTLTACAGMQQVQLGIPADVAPRFFFHVEAAGRARGLSVSKHPDSVNLRTRQGDWLQYMVQQDAINLVLLPNTKGLSEPQIRERQAELRALSDSIVAEARSRASQAKAFE